MAAPLVFGAIAAGAALLGAGASIWGGITGANAERDKAKADQDAANLQAQYSTDAMWDALRRGNMEAGKLRSAGSKAIGAERVAYAGSGVDVGEGSTLDTYATSRANSELDIMTVKNNAAREAWGYMKDASALRQTGRYARQGGENRATASLLSGTAGGVQGLSSAATILGSIK